MTTAARLAACALAALLAVGCRSLGDAPTAIGASGHDVEFTQSDAEDLKGLIESGDLVRAEKLAARLFGDGGEERSASDIHADFAALLEQVGRPDDAEMVLMNALLDDPKSPRLLNHLAYHWAVRDMELERAEVLVKKALAQCPDDPAYLDTLGWICYRQERYPEAWQNIARALDLNGPDPEILDHLGDVLYAMGDDSLAICAWLDSLSSKADQPRVVEKLRDAWTPFLEAVMEEREGRDQ